MFCGGINHFDVASLEEVKLVHARCSSSTLYFQHPVKARSAIRNSYGRYGLCHFVVDHHRELSKVVAEIMDTDGVTIYVRLGTPPGGANEHLAGKFGASVEEAVSLLNEVNNVGCKAALSFHVGSQCYDPRAYRTALTMVDEIMRRAGTPIVALDVGGGFPASYINMSAPPLAEYIRIIVEGASSLSLG